MKTKYLDGNHSLWVVEHSNNSPLITHAESHCKYEFIVIRNKTGQKIKTNIFTNTIEEGEFIIATTLPNLIKE